MARKPDPPKPENHERWIISYADFITLLFAAFVALFAVSSLDAGKASMFQLSVQDALDRPVSEKLLFQTLDARVRRPSDNPSLSQSLISSRDEHCSGSPGSTLTTAELQEKEEADREAEARAARRMRRLHRDLEVLSEDPALKGKIEVEKLNDREIRVRLVSAGFFESGAADPLALALDVLEAISGKVTPYREVEIRVEGHTDDTPVRGRFASNWELSTARAGAVVRAMVGSFGMEPTRMMASGFGEFRPIAENSTPQGRAQNRRIDVLLHHPAPRDLEEAAAFRQDLTEGSEEAPYDGTLRDGGGIESPSPEPDAQTPAALPGATRGPSGPRPLSDQALGSFEFDDVPLSPARDRPTVERTPSAEPATSAPASQSEVVRPTSSEPQGPLPLTDEALDGFEFDDEPKSETPSPDDSADSER